MSRADADSGRLRLYTVLVDLHRKTEVEVLAANEDDARQQARETAVSQLPAADAWSTEILKAADVTVAIGSRITHELFGTGTVQAVVTLASASRKRLLRVAVQFDHGEDKELVLPHPRVSLAAPAR
ncbi:MAG: hypothetical protein E6R02_00610 [Gammaproteobacteria bacterium]|nr:MAG: hypothetical protein E6R02_00610 [Gammaproteobacteria bacterium]